MKRLLIILAFLLLLGCTEVSEDKCLAYSPVEDNGKWNDCYLMLAGDRVKRGDSGGAVDACEQIVTVSFTPLNQRDDCYYLIATLSAANEQTSAAIDFCNELGGTQKRRLCYAEVAEIVHDPDICDYIGEEGAFFKQTAIESCRARAAPPNQIYYCPSLILLAVVFLGIALVRN